MEYIIGVILIFAFGVLVGWLIKKPKHYGIIRVDESDPDEAPYLFLQLSHDKNVYSIIRERYVTFKVEAKNFISQK